MIKHKLQQGSDDWHQFRLEHFGASEAAAMLGLSSKVKRTELLHMKHTGNAKEFSDWVQKNILDYGHEVEEAARPIIEEIFGIDLYPVTCSDGRLSASCDGLTLCEETAFEHKQWSESLAASVREDILPEEHMPQCQQIAMITGAKRVIFTVSDGTDEKMVSMQVSPDQEWFERIRAGWAQFEKDLAEYVPVAVVEPAKAPAPKDLPVVSIQVRGELTMSNLSDATPHFDRFLSQARTDLKTDDDFAVAEAESKLGRETAKRCKLTAKAVIDQIMPVSEVVRTLEEYAEKFNALALRQEKAVKEQKDAIKDQILSDAKAKFSAHVASLAAELTPIKFELQEPPFVSAMKGKRTLSSLHDAADTTLANAKILANEIAGGVRAKLAWINENANDYRFLLADLQQIIYKPAADFQIIVQSRIGQHKLDEQKRLEAERARVQAEADAKIESERKRIQIEEQKKAEEKIRNEKLEAARDAIHQATLGAILQDAVQATIAPAPTETAKPVLVKSESKTEPAYSPALFHLAINELQFVRKKFSPIAELAGVMREIDLFLKSQEKTA